MTLLGLRELGAFYPSDRNVKGFGRGPWPGPMLLDLRHRLLYASRPCRHGHDADTGLVQAMPLPPAPAYPSSLRPSSRRPGKPMPPQPAALGPNLGLIVELPIRTLKVLRWRWGLMGAPVHNFREIGVKLGISAGRAAHIDKAAIRWLRQHPDVVVRAHLEHGLWDPRGQPTELLLEW